MKKFSIRFLLSLVFFLFISCGLKNNGEMKYMYSDLLYDDFESTKYEIEECKGKIFYITGVIKRISRPKDQPGLNECIIYFYDNQIFDEKKSVGKMIKIKMKSAVNQEMLGKEVTVKCKYKGVDSFIFEEDYNNYFLVEFKNGKIIDKL